MTGFISSINALYYTSLIKPHPSVFACTCTVVCHTACMLVKKNPKSCLSKYS